MLTISQGLFAHKVSQNHFAIWNANSMEVAFIRCDEDMLDRINYKEILLNKLSKENNSFLNNNIYYQENLLNSQKIEITQMVLLVSTMCNHNCSYCQIEENILPCNKTNMSIDTAMLALKVFANNIKKDNSNTLTITGGEPLLNYDVTKFIIEQARKMFGNIRIVVFTNGSLVTDDIAMFFSENNVQTIISLDGPKEIHNITRKDKHQKGTFDAVINGYNILKRHNCRIGISSVGGLHNYKDYNSVLQMYYDLAPDSVGYNIPHFLIDKNNPVDLPVDSLVNAIIDIYKGVRKNGIYFENISRIINAFSHRSPRINECQAQGKGFTVDARGKIGPCKSLVINDIFSIDIEKDLIISEDKMFQLWSTRTPLRIETCQNCVAKYLCGGGCAYDSYIRHYGNYMQIDDRLCGFNHKILEFLLVDLYEYVKDKMSGQSVYFVSKEEQEVAFSRYYSHKPLQRSVGH